METIEGLKLVAISLVVMTAVVLLLLNIKLTEKQAKAIIIGITVILSFSIILCVYLFLKNNFLI